jgi:phage terminase large subunit
MTAGLKFREWAKMLFKPKRYKVAFGGRGCLHPDALIDTPNGQIKISEFKGGDVYSWHNGKIVVAQATPSKEYTEEDLYQVVFEDGRSIIATDEHRFLTTKGWVYLKHLSSSCGVVLQRQKLPSCLHHSSNDFIISKVRLIHKHSRQKYWDLHVFKTNNYLSNGIVNHNSGKSWTYTDALLAKALSEKIGVLCAREFQNSMSESVHKLLTQRIEDLGFSQYFEIQRDVIRCTLTKSEFIFKGLRNNVESLKSLSGIDICWIEEAQVISQESLDILIPTIRKPNSEIWFTMNPRLTDDPVYKQFVLTDDPDVYKAKVNYTENKHFPEVLELERRRMLERDPALYNHIWLGECLTHTDAQVFKDKWEVREFTPDKWDLPFYGMDFGFSQDPTACVKVWLHDDSIYIEKEAVKVGLELDETADYIKGFMPEIEQAHIIRADCARPESISYLERNGLRGIKGVKKWKGSVEDGITHLRSYRRIVVHPRCTNTINEMMLYSYKVDARTGDITNTVLDKHNHVIDAIRYSIEPLIKRPFSLADVFGD